MIEFRQKNFGLAGLAVKGAKLVAKNPGAALGHTANGAFAASGIAGIFQGARGNKLAEAANNQAKEQAKKELELQKQQAKKELELREKLAKKQRANDVRVAAIQANGRNPIVSMKNSDGILSGLKNALNTPVVEM